MFNYIAGLGGRDITAETVKEVYFQTKEKKTPDDESIWIGLKTDLEGASNDNGSDGTQP